MEWIWGYERTVLTESTNNARILQALELCAESDTVLGRSPAEQFNRCLNASGVATNDTLEKLYDRRVDWFPYPYEMYPEQLAEFVDQYKRALTPYYEYSQGYGYDDYASERPLFTKFNRNFIKDLHKLDARTLTKVLNFYVFVLARGHITNRTFISNYRKYSEDSYEFYVPIADTDLILTWRLFADLCIGFGQDGTRNMNLIYCLSFDSLSTEELRTEAVLFECSPLVDELLRLGSIPVPPPVAAKSLKGFLLRDYEYNLNNRITIHIRLSLNELLEYGKLSHEEFVKRGWFDPFDCKKPYLLIWIVPRFVAHNVAGTPRLDNGTLGIRKMAPVWMIEAVEAYNRRILEDTKKGAAGLPEEEYKEYKLIRKLVEDGYEVWTCDRVTYPALVEKRSKPMQIYYDRADGEVFLKAIKPMSDKLIGVQRDVVGSDKNLLFFGRSGTGKTHCCNLAMVGRHLTAEAIAKKLKTSSDTTTKPQQSGMKSIFITASPLLAKEVKAQYETTLKRAETANNKETPVILTEDLIFKNIQSNSGRSKELPRTFFDEDITYPMFLSHHEFVSILYTTMVEGSQEFRHLGDRVKLEVNDEEIMKSFGQQTEKVSKALHLMPKRKGRAASSVQSKRQIDFRTFYEEFYKKKIARNSKLGKISSNVAWSEIRTKIKGSSFQYFEKNQGMRYNPNDEKLVKDIKTHYESLQKDERINKLVFEIFESYENWKTDNNYFDIEDFVGLFYRKIKKWPFKDFNFDMIVIDEVQDLSFNSIQVLTNLCLNNFMICGDNAQNIEKGINFKFKDLGNYLTQAITNRSEKIVDYGDYYNQSKNLPELVSYHLGLNFRSSKQILDLANMAVCLLETFFFNEIDSFPKEKGFFSSPKPVLAELGMDINSLISFLEVYLQVETTIVADANESMNDSAQLINKKIQNGSDFCVIVRDEQAKKNIPDALKNCIVLTLQESKGLEFENVLLFNHFTGNDAEKGWRYIYNRTVIDNRAFTKEEKQGYETEVDMFRRSKLEFCKLVKGDGTENLFEFSTTAALEQISTQAQLEGLSADIKFLYVAITRAKKNLIIYDYTPTKGTNHLRTEFDKWCKKLDLVNEVTSANLDTFKGIYEADPNWKATQQNIAREKGYFFLKNNEYGSADRFFKVSGDAKLIKYCKASEKAKLAGDLLSLEFDDELAKKYGSLSLMQKEAKSTFVESAELFTELDKPNEAGKCFFSAEDYARAENCFRQADNKLYLAHSLFMQKMYEASLPIYYELEQDDMVQACLYHLSENGKDMARFAALLASMSDEVKEVAKYDDGTFMRYIKNVFDELQRDIKDAEDLDEFQAEDKQPQQEMMAEPIDEMSEKKDDDVSSFVMVSDSKSLDEFSEIRSLVSEIRSAGGSFEKLPSLKSEGGEAAKQGIIDKITARLDAHTKRIIPLLKEMPGSSILFINDQQSIQNLIFDLAVVFRFEDLGLELLKSAAIVKKAKIFDRLIVNKLINLDFNLNFNKKIDLFKVNQTPSVGELAKKANISELVTLNVFDIITAYKMSGLEEIAFSAIDDIIRIQFKHIATLGLAEFFYPLASDIKIREQLSYLIGTQDMARIQTAELGDFKLINTSVAHPKESLSTLTIGDILNQLSQLDLDKLVIGFVNPSERKSEDTIFTLITLIRELFERLTQINISKSADKDQEATNEISASEVWTIIRILRVLFKRKHSIVGPGSEFSRNTWDRLSGMTSGSKLTLAGGRFSDFYILQADNWILNLARSVDDLKNSVKVEKDLVFYSLNRLDDILLTEQHSFYDFSFSLCVCELLSRFKVRNQRDLIKMEVLSQLSMKEKSSFKFNKLYTKKTEDTMALFDFDSANLKVIEDYIYTRATNLLSKSSTPKGINFLAVFQNYSSLDRNLASDKVTAALIRSECEKHKNSRPFFICEELDLKLREGHISEAYFKLQDLDDYIEHNNIEVTRGCKDWIVLKEALILLLAYCISYKKESSFNRPDGILLPSYFQCELNGLEWIAPAGNGKYYLDMSKVDTTALEEMLLNFDDKFNGLLNEVSKAMYQTVPDLGDYIQDIQDHRNEPSVRHSEYLQVVQIDKPSGEVTEVLNKHAEKISVSNFNKDEATKTVKKAENSNQFRTLKNESTIPFVRRQQILAQNRGKTPISSVLSYHFLSNLLDQIDIVEPTKTSAINLAPVSQHAIPQFKAFLTAIPTVNQANPQPAKASQDELKLRMEIIQVIGSGIYKRIENRKNSKKSASSTTKK